MWHDLTSDQEMIRKTVGKIASEVLLPAAGKIDEEYLFNHDGIRVLGKAGFMGMILPLEFGGSINFDSTAFP